MGSAGSGFGFLSLFVQFLRATRANELLIVHARQAILLAALPTSLQTILAGILPASWAFGQAIEAAGRNAVMAKTSTLPAEILVAILAGINFLTADMVSTFITAVPGPVVEFNKSAKIRKPFYGALYAVAFGKAAPNLFFIFTLFIE